MVNLSCETKSAEATANGTATTYCSTNDTECSTCTATSADPICMGEDGACICPSLCSVIKPTGTSGCTSSEESTMMYVGVAVGMICVASFVFFVAKCRNRDLAIVRRRAFESQFRRESELLRMRQPQLALNLVGWRDTVELDKPELHKLGECCYAANQEERNGNAESTCPMGAIAVDEGESIMSVGTSPTISKIESPTSFLEAARTASPTAGEHEDDCDYKSIDDKSR